MVIIRTKTFPRRRARQPILAELAKRVREVYIQERRLWDSRLCGGERGSCSAWTPARYWDGGKNRMTGAKVPPYWPRIVQFLLKHSITDFQAYIAVQFSARRLMGPAPTPKHMVGEKALQVWKNYRKSFAKTAGDLRHSLNCQKGVFSHAILRLHKELPRLSPNQVRDGVLLDTDLALTALFRYCLAMSKGLAKIARVYELAAKAEFLANRAAYCSAWRAWIPESLKEKVGRELSCSMEELNRG